uniref:Uncharacterized protein n=1 Tax=Arundo donax TaxID=35708 RepID=A0A0A8XPT1_ARUDO
MNMPYGFPNTLICYDPRLMYCFQNFLYFLVLSIINSLFFYYWQIRGSSEIHQYFYFCLVLVSKGNSVERPGFQTQYSMIFANILGM